MVNPYDPRDALAEFSPGSDMTRGIEDAIMLQWNANGQQPLTSDQVVAIVIAQTGAQPPAYPTGMVRFADSNPDPMDGWSIDMPGRYLNA